MTATTVQGDDGSTKIMEFFYLQRINISNKWCVEGGEWRVEGYKAIFMACCSCVYGDLMLFYWSILIQFQIF